MVNQICEVSLKTVAFWFMSDSNKLIIAVSLEASYCYESQLTKIVHKAITLANHKGHKQSNEPIKFHSKDVADEKRGKTCASELWLVLVLLVIGQKIGASFLNQLCSMIMQNQLLFDTQVKTALNNEALINNRVWWALLCSSPFCMRRYRDKA